MIKVVFTTLKVIPNLIRMFFLNFQNHLFYNVIDKDHKFNTKLKVFSREYSIYSFSFPKNTYRKGAQLKSTTFKSVIKLKLVLKIEIKLGKLDRKCIDCKEYKYLFWAFVYPICYD